MDVLALWIGERLLTGSLEVVGLVALVWLTCRFVRQMPASVQAALWWLVALKLVLVFAPVPSIPVPVLPARFDPQAEPVQAMVFATAETVQMSSRNTLLQGLILIWFAVILAHAGRLALAHRHLRGVVRRSVEWTDADIGGLAARLGLKRTPAVRLSDEIGSPQVFGLWSPIVLMPAKTLTAFTDDERAMTLCHELMHVRRRDLAFGWVPACAERLFFFHPLARVAAREYLTAREAACDAAAVRALGVEAGDYGRMLIRLGIGDVRPAMAAGGSPFSASSLKRRLHMLEHQPVKTSRRWLWSVALIGAAVIPIQLVARTPAAPQERARKVIVAPGPVKEREIVLITDGIESMKLKSVEDQKEIKLQREKDKFFENQDDVELQLEVEKLKRVLEEKKLAQTLEKEFENVRAKAEQTFNEQTLREEFEKLIAAAEAASQADKALTYRDVIQKALQDQERRQVARRDEEELARGLQRLAERLERLAAEQRQLADELRRLQQQSPR